jgi:hypothetical protein
MEKDCSMVSVRVGPAFGRSSVGPGETDVAVVSQDEPRGSNPLQSKKAGWKGFSPGSEIRAPEAQAPTPRLGIRTP